MSIEDVPREGSHEMKVVETFGGEAFAIWSSTFIMQQNTALPGFDN
jgi:hypothetical protein